MTVLRLVRMTSVALCLVPLAAQLRAQAPTHSPAPAVKRPGGASRPAAPRGEVDTSRVYTYVEQMPTLAGGGNDYIDRVLGRAISRLVVLPGRETVGGRAVLEAVVEPDGTLGRLKLRSTATPALAEVILAAAHRVPKLTPGRQSGTPVPVRLMLPIRVEVQ